MHASETSNPSVDPAVFESMFVDSRGVKVPLNVNFNETSCVGPTTSLSVSGFPGVSGMKMSVFDASEHCSRSATMRTRTMLQWTVVLKIYA